MFKKIELMKAKQFTSIMLHGNLINDTNKSDKYCSFCGTGNKSNSKHGHLVINNSRSNRKSSREWRWL